MSTKQLQKAPEQPQRRLSAWRANSILEPLLAENQQKPAITRDPFRDPFRQRLLEEPERALDTLEAYATLHLDVLSAHQLLACDVSGRSDPFVEVYVNDRLEGKSTWKVFTVNPEWNYHIDLKIFSPLSIVQIRVMDHDTLTQNDLVGFLELRVAELAPDEVTQGWFELRRKRHLHGVASGRVRRHFKWRDDHPAHVALHHEMEQIFKRESAGHGNRLDEEEEEGRGPRQGDAAQSPRSKTNSFKRCATAAAVCMGMGAKKDLEDSDEGEKQGSLTNKYRRSVETLIDKAKFILNGETSRPNAGELHLRLHLETSGNADDEWYGFCFPRPSFFLYPSGRLDLGHLYHDLFAVKEMFVCTIQTVFCVPRYLLSWKCWPLTLVLMLWFWALCVWPREVLSSIFLWVIILIQLLRRKRWQDAVLVHAAFAPLNDVGFLLVASLGKTSAMVEWLHRLIKSMGLHAKDDKLLAAHAALLFKEGKPCISFTTLVSDLRKQPWMHEPSGHPRCFEGHALSFMGTSADDGDWLCQNPIGCCSYGGSSLWGEISHYHCETCRLHFCEHCVAQLQKPPLWTRMPTYLLPDSFSMMLLRIEEPLEHWRHTLEGLLHLVATPFRADKAADKAARRVSVFCFVLWLLGSLTIWLLTGPFRKLMDWGLTTCLLLGGTAIFTFELRCFRRWRTALRATADSDAYTKKRANFSFAERCACFRAEAPTAAAPPVKVKVKDASPPSTAAANGSSKAAAASANANSASAAAAAAAAAVSSAAAWKAAAAANNAAAASKVASTSAPTTS